MKKMLLPALVALALMLAPAAEARGADGGE